LNTPSNTVASKVSAALGASYFPASESIVSTAFLSEVKLDFAANRQRQAADAVFGGAAAPLAAAYPIERANSLVEKQATAAATKYELADMENWDVTLRQIAGRHATARRAAASLRQQLDAVFNDLDISDVIL
jgi:hypothetical protein